MGGGACPWGRVLGVGQRLRGGACPQIGGFEGRGVCPRVGFERRDVSTDWGFKRRGVPWGRVLGPRTLPPQSLDIAMMPFSRIGSEPAADWAPSLHAAPC